MKYFWNKQGKTVYLYRFSIKIYRFEVIPEELLVVDVRDVSVHHRIETEPRYGFDTQFGGEVFPVAQYGVYADVQAVGDFFVHEPAGYEFQYFGFAGR